MILGASGRCFISGVNHLGRDDDLGTLCGIKVLHASAIICDKAVQMSPMLVWQKQWLKSTEFR